MRQTLVSAIIWEEEGIFVSNCPELNVASTGKDAQSALTNLKKGIDIWLSNIRDLGILEDFRPILRYLNESFQLG